MSKAVLSALLLMNEKGYVEVPAEVYAQWLEEMAAEKERRAGFK